MKEIDMEHGYIIWFFVCYGKWTLEMRLTMRFNSVTCGLFLYIIIMWEAKICMTVNSWKMCCNSIYHKLPELVI